MPTCMLQKYEKACMTATLCNDTIMQVLLSIRFREQHPMQDTRGPGYRVF